MIRANFSERLSKSSSANHYGRAAWRIGYVIDNGGNRAITEPTAADSYGQFLAELNGRIHMAQLRASLAVNGELVLL